MTDNNIIKALESVKKNPTPFSLENKVMIASLDLINRQKTEIERLKAEIRNTDNILNSLDRPLIEVKSEAIKEFWDKLKAKATTSTDSPYRMHKKEIKISDGDNLVKEMVGE